MIDLFQIHDDTELLIVFSDDPEYNAQVNINEANQVKIDNELRQLREINNQLDGLRKEKAIETDALQIKFIDDVIKALKVKKSDIKAKLKELTMINVPVINKATIHQYKTFVNSILSRIGNRGLTLTEFYHEAFRRLGHDNQFHIRIWDNYFHKKLTQTPSMIFSLINGIITKLIYAFQDNRFDANRMNELKVILEFMTRVKDYIELKYKLPNCLCENPV